MAEEKKFHVYYEEFNTVDSAPLKMVVRAKNKKEAERKANDYGVPSKLIQKIVQVWPEIIVKKKRPMKKKAATK